MIDPERVGALVRAASRDEILARFRLLREGQIHQKPSETDPDDIVTDADLAAERRLAAELGALLPGSVVVGEEGVAADPLLLGALGGGAPVWLVDPLDGTRNFAAGREEFGTMVALAVGRETRAAWIYLPTEDTLVVAEAGGGATVNGAPARVPETPLVPPPRGTIYDRHMPAGLREEIHSRAAMARLVPGPGSACTEYVAVLRGEKDFVVYHRLHPWDHAPGALILTEAGGASRHADGSPYRPGAPSQPTLLARHARLWPSLAASLLG